MTSTQFGNRARPIVYYVTDRKALHRAGSIPAIEKIRAAAEAEVDFLQIREKDLPARELLDLTCGAIRAAEANSAKVRIIVNDRLDVALAAGAAGVHLGGESPAARDVVKWCRNGNAPPEFLVGVSCHTIEEAREAEISGASYAIFGPVFHTPSKERFGPPQEIAKLGEICQAVRIPVIAIGGVTVENAVDCMKAGATGVAAIRLFQNSRDFAALKDTITRLHRIRLY